MPALDINPSRVAALGSDQMRIESNRERHRALLCPARY
jgi:hypothetical protein